MSSAGVMMNGNCPMCGTNFNVATYGKWTCPKCNGVVNFYDPRTRRSDVPPPVNHLLHIGLCILTAGLWLPVYAIILIGQGAKRRDYLMRHGEPAPRLHY